MSVTPETSHAERFALKLNALAPLNMSLMSVTRVRSGASVALYTMLCELLNISFMVVQAMPPHCLNSTSLSALKLRLPIDMPVSPPDMETVKVSVEPYVWPAVPDSLVMVPSPQSTVYDPEAGMVMPRLRSELRHTVTKGGSDSGVSADAAMPLPAASNTALASTSSWGAFRAAIDVRWDCVNVTFSAEPDTAAASPSPGVTPPEDWPDART